MRRIRKSGTTIIGGGRRTSKSRQRTIGQGLPGAYGCVFALDNLAEPGGAYGFGLFRVSLDSHVGIHGCDMALLFNAFMSREYGRSRGATRNVGGGRPHLRSLFPFHIYLHLASAGTGEKVQFVHVSAEFESKNAFTHIHTSTERNVCMQMLDTGMQTYGCHDASIHVHSLCRYQFG